MIDYGYGVTLRDMPESLCDVARNWRNKKAIRDYCRQVGLISQTDQRVWWERGDRKHLFAIKGAIQSKGAPLPYEDGCGDEDPPDEHLIIGVGGLTSIHPTHRSAEISLYVAEEFHGLTVPGVALAIIKTIAAYAFEELNLNRIFGDTFDTNQHEILNLQELGFTHEGTLRQSYYKNGHYINSHIQALLRTEYEERKNGW